jgi:Protein of unknown function (DUF2911)
MKRVLIIIGVVIAVLVVALAGYLMYSSTKSPKAKAQFNENGLSVTVDYCQPSKKGRKIFGELLPFGKVWRTGANAATVIEFNKAVTVAGKPVPAGKYSVWTIPAADSTWTLILNKETGQWGTMYDEKQDFARIPVLARAAASPIELFKIEFVPQTGGTDMVLGWESTEAVVPIRAQ